MKTRIRESIAKVQAWVERHDYTAYEPFDGLSSVFRPLTMGNLFLERVLMQVVRRTPLNIRPLLGIHPLPSTKGMGYMAWGYLTIYAEIGESEYRRKALSCLDWLDRNRSPRFTDHSWANHFDFSSRGGRYTADESIIVWTSLVGQAFLDAYTLLGEERHLRIIESIARWILSLPREKTASGTCLSYLATRQTSIHNANMLGAAFLAQAARVTGNAQAGEVAREAMAYSCTRQRDDGSWLYGEEPKYHWIDNFHTGYNLDSLKRYIVASNDVEFEPQLRKGFRYYIENFFEPNGCPRYYHDKTYPIDSQCSAQSIDTLAFLAEGEGEALDMACRVASWTIDNMQDADGHFYFRRYRLGITDRTPMLHWAQATTFKALTELWRRL